jgi:UDP-glucose 4-epimerase
MILVTGTTGFIGSHLLRKLVGRYGAENICAITRRPITGIRCVLHDGYNNPVFDCAGHSLSDIKALLHVGAYTPKSNQPNSDMSLANQNIAFTNRLLSLPLPNLERVVFASTLDVYDDAEMLDELTPVRPRSVYAKSKLACEELISDFGKSRGVVSHILRLGHVYGPGEDHYQKIIPTIMRSLLVGGGVRLVGSGGSKRSYIYVEDVTDIISKSLDHLENVGPVNVAGNESISMTALADLIIRVSGRQAAVVYEPGLDSPDRIFDTRKLNSLFTQVQIPLRVGLEMEWRYMSEKYDEHPN